MSITRYHTLNGELVGESTSGSAIGYLTDALGSVTSTVTPYGVIANSYVYEPFGSVLAKTGSAADPKFLWVGSAGYRATSRMRSESYVRARHMGQGEGLWTSVDPLWPSERAYVYAEGRSTLLTDFTGLACSCCCCPGGVTNQDQKKHYNEDVPVPPPGKPRTMKDYSGITVNFVPSWNAMAYGSPPPDDMGPCTLKWEEWWRGQSGYSDSGWAGSVENLFWTGDPCKSKSDCASGQCSIWDAPGISPSGKQTGWLAICMRITLNATCSSCTGGKTSTVNYFRFQIQLLNGKATEIVLNPSDASCDPTKLV